MLTSITVVMSTWGGGGKKLSENVVYVIYEWSLSGRSCPLQMRQHQVLRLKRKKVNPRGKKGRKEETKKNKIVKMISLFVF